MSNRKIRGSSRVTVLVAIVAALGAGILIQRSGAIGDEPRKEVNQATLKHAQELSEAFHNAAEVAMPSVVTIRSKAKTREVARNGREENPLKGTPLEDLFKGRGLDEFMKQQPRREGMGSGVIIDREGLVLTNNHVVEGADEVIVTLADGREFKADDIKTDEHTDLAILRIRNAGTLPTARLGDSDKMRIGDWVVAIGNPFGFEQTVSAGIISGMGRELGASGKRARFLQTDAAINPGNSGGPLINLEGDVIGINTAIASSNGSFNGLGFAIPVNLAKWVKDQLASKGSVQRAYLGIGLQDMTGDLAEKLGGHRGEGVLVAKVFANTPASEAGFESGDIIVKFAGQKVKDRGELQSIVERSALDTKHDVEILRDSKTQTLQVMPKAMPKDFAAVERFRRGDERSQPEHESYEAEDLGVEVTNLTPDRAEELGLKETAGVLVTKVDSNKPAYDNLIRSGMVIMKVGKKSVKNIEDFRTALKGESLKEGIVLYVHTPNGVDSFVVVKE